MNVIAPVFLLVTRKSSFSMPIIEIVLIFLHCTAFPDLRFVGTGGTGGPVNFFLTVYNFGETTRILLEIREAIAREK